MPKSNCLYRKVLIIECFIIFSDVKFLPISEKLRKSLGTISFQLVTLLNTLRMLSFSKLWSHFIRRNISIKLDDARFGRIKSFRHGKHVAVTSWLSAVDLMWKIINEMNLCVSQKFAWNIDSEFICWSWCRQIEILIQDVTNLIRLWSAKLWCSPDKVSYHLSCIWIVLKSVFRLFSNNAFSSQRSRFTLHAQNQNIEFVLSGV